eukprot:6457880-Amphidinium_carterae.1
MSTVRRALGSLLLGRNVNGSWNVVEEWYDAAFCQQLLLIFSSLFNMPLLWRVRWFTNSSKAAPRSRKQTAVLIGLACKVPGDV